MKRILSFFNNKKFKHGSLSIVFAAVFVAAVIMLNIIAGLVFEHFDLLSFDITSDQRFSVDESTTEFLAGIGSEITITVASREGDFVGNGPFYNQANEIFKRFAGESPNITLSYIDFMSNPDFAANYPNLTGDSVIIKSEKTGRYKMLNTENYFNSTYYDSRDGSQISKETYEMLAPYGMATMDVSAATEGALLTAIVSVVDENPVFVGFTTGFGESKKDVLTGNIEKYSYTVSDVDLVTGDIDPVLDFIVIFSPKSDYSSEALKKLEEWLDNGGKFGKTLLYTAHVSAETPNLDSFLSDWGIEIERAFVRQTDMQTDMMSFQRFTPLEHNDGLNPLYDVYGMFFRHTLQIFEAARNITTKPILSSSDSVLYPFDEMSEDSTWDFTKAERGDFNVGVVSTKTRFEGTDAFSSNVIAFGGEDIFNSSLLMMQNANNSEFIINIFNDISGKDDFIPPLAAKSFTVPTFQISQEQANLTGIIFVFILPIVIITAGVVIWTRRMRK